MAADKALFGANGLLQWDADVAPEVDLES